MDLFTPVISEKDFHPTFRALLSQHSVAPRAVVNRWANGFVDRDGKFVREFQSTFNSGFWELYVFACCKEMGLKAEFRYPAPDFVISNFHNEFCIEAVIASNARGESAEWERNDEVQPTTEEVFKTAIIRLSNALQSKHSKYLQAYQTLKHVMNRPFVVALGPFEQRNFWAQNDHAIRALLYSYDRVGSDGQHKFITSVKKASGSTIDLGLFTSNKMAEISAVLFSNTATMSKLYALDDEDGELTWFSALRFNHFGPGPLLEKSLKRDYDESLLDGIYVFHNPYARIPLPFSYFNHNDIAQGSVIHEDGVPRYKCKHRHLIQRSCFRLRSRPSDARDK